MQNYKSTILTLLLIISILPTLQSQQENDTDLNVKNVIVFISDGCGYNHIEATSNYQHGKPDGFVFNEFPVNIGMSTYQIGNSYDEKKAWESFKYLKKNPTDSAASATTMASGKATYYGSIGYIGENAENAKPTQSAVHFAKQNGKATGVVTSVEFAHATPASFVAHNKSRNNYPQIAREMLTESNVDLIMGCGHPIYDSSGKEMEKPNYKFVGDKALWEKLIAGELEAPDCNGDGKPDTWKFIQTREEFQQLAKTSTPPTRVCGIPQSHETLQARRSKKFKQQPFKEPFNNKVPTLVEMTDAAINMLSHDKDGFFLMIEGGAIDWASHANEIGRMIEEETDFVASVASATKWVEANSSWEETLIIVTGDHECGCLAGPKTEGTVEEQLTLKPSEKGQTPEVRWLSKGHTNQLIPFFAKGPEPVMQRIKKLADQKDPVRGPYIHNTEMGQTIVECVRNKKSNIQ